MLDFYLSEISISNGHGGGISLQNVLGDDLSQIDRFVHLTRFANDVPPIESVRARSVDVFSPFESDAWRSRIGFRAADRLRRTEWSSRRDARTAARAIARLMEGRPTVRALICPQGLRAIHATARLRERLPLQYITWVMDDHIVRRRGGAWHYSREARRSLGRHLRDASTVFVISPALAAFYEREFGISSEVLFGPADLPDTAIRHASASSGPLTIGYFGRVWEWQIDEIVKFASRLRVGREVLHIYNPDTYWDQYLKLPTIELKGVLPRSDVSSRMRDYDAVLIPMGFGDSQRNLTEFNIATKLSECLASGTVTIVYGPEYAAMVQYLRPTGAAVLLTDQELGDWPSLADSLRDDRVRRTVVESAQRLVRAEMSTDAMHRRWRAALAKLTA